MKIEHRVAQSMDEARDLEWSNLLGACRGELSSPSGRGANVLHCDSSKGDQAIDIDPTNATHIACLFYEPGGTLRSSRPNHQDEINGVLNLNVLPLRERRTRVLAVVQLELNKRFGARTLPKVQVKRLLELYRSPRGDQPPFVGFLCWWLERAQRKAV